MDKITIENIEKEIERILDTKPMNCENLEKFVLLCKAMKYMGKLHREFTMEDAEKWVHGMHPGFKWTMEQTTAVMRQKGYHHKPCEFWAVMNSLYSDYGQTMKKYNADLPEIWADLANDWLDDADAVENKVGVYFRDIVQHD
jgi:hypothetical protein